MIGSYYNNIRHTLEHKKKGFLTITDPVGYDQADVEFTRNKKHHGIVANFSSSLKFVKDGLEYIEDVIKTYGLNEEVLIHRFERNPSTDAWEKVYSGTLDLTTTSTQNKELSIKINSGVLEKTLRARESEKLEIESTSSIDGDILPALPTENLTIVGRELLLKSLLEYNATVLGVQDLDFANGMATYSATRAVPIEIIYKSSENIHSPIQEESINGYDVNGMAGMMFVAQTPVERSLVVSWDMEFTPREIHAGATEEFKLSFAIYRNEGDYIYDREVVVRYWDEASDYHHVTFNEIGTATINLNEGESVALVFSSKINIAGSTTNDLLMEVRNITASLTIEEDSTYENTDTKMVMLHGLGERLSHLITGKPNVFKSSILGRISDGYTSNGEHALIGAYCGHWLRGFDALPNNEDNKYKPFTTSFKDFAQTLKSVFNISVGIQTIGFNDFIVAESMSYFYNPNIAIILPRQISNVKRIVASDYIYSGVEIGYEKGGEYEEVFGLDEPNGKTNFVSNFTSIKKVYKELSKYRADVYGEEIQRRKQRIIKPTEDATFDKDIFLKDLKVENGILKERFWSDDFSQEPTGIFSPGTAKNLRLSPVRNLMRHGRDIGIAMKQYKYKFLKYGSSTANSSMSTRLIGEATNLAENADILNSKLGTRRFDPEYIEFDYSVDFNLLQQLKSSTTFNGVEIPNFYCKIQFTNENGKTEFGYLVSVKTTGKGVWKLLKA